jgi:hypothetical protein
VLQYLAEQCDSFTSKKLQEMLNAAGAYGKLDAAVWLRQQGAEWPAVLKFTWKVWEGDTLAWAVQETLLRLMLHTTLMKVHCCSTTTAARLLLLRQMCDISMHMIINLAFCAQRSTCPSFLLNGSEIVGAVQHISATRCIAFRLH